MTVFCLSVQRADNVCADILRTAVAAQHRRLRIEFDLAFSCFAAHLAYAFIQVRKARRRMGVSERSTAAVGVDRLVAVIGGTLVADIFPSFSVRQVACDLRGDELSEFLSSVLN